MEHSRFDDITKSFAASSRRSLLGMAGGAMLAALLGHDERGADAKKKKCKKPKAKCGKACVNRKTDARHCGACGNACTAGQTCVNGSCVGGGECRFGQPGADQACCPPGFPNCDPYDTRFSIHRRCESDGVCRCPKTAVDNKPRYFCATTGAPFPDCRDCCDDAHCALDGQFGPQGKTYCYPGSRTCQCPDGLTDCVIPNGTPGRQCVNTATDNTNCGGCGVDNPDAHRCNTAIGEQCVSGSCTVVGPP
jgi:hypothetical protein